MNIFDFKLSRALPIIGSILIFSLASCSSMTHLDGEEFLRQAEQAREHNSAHDTVYVGHSSRRAYLEHWSSWAFWRRDNIAVYWTHMQDLPPEVASRLRRGENPWKIEPEVAQGILRPDSILGQELGAGVRLGRDLPEPATRK
ncbi:MAG: hypothetical protein RL095_873 [Verrucomicrobiota bacterium]|jgi:hypothetical protein